MSRVSRVVLCASLAVPAVAAGRRGDAPSTMKVPTVEEVVSAEGFEPTPSQTELYRPGAVLVPNARGGHDAVVDDCIGVDPAVSIMSQSSIATTLSAGVSTRLGVGAAAASAGVQKRLTFIDPEQRTISLGVLEATDDCKQQLANAARFQDLSRAIVVHDVLVAIIQNTVCTRADAKGRVIALGEAEAAAFSECVQESDAQVPLGFKSVPLSKLVATAPAGAAAAPVAATSPGLDFGGTADLGVEARLKEQQCARDAEKTGAAGRAARLQVAQQDVLAQASAAWTKLEPEASACVGLRRSERARCIQAVEQWLDTAERMTVDLPASVETARTACGTRDAAFPAESKSVAAREVSAARSLLHKLQTAADPKAAAVVVSGGPSTEGGLGGPLQQQLADFTAMTISGPSTPMSETQTNKVLMDQLVAKAKALGALESALVDVVKQGNPGPAVAALVMAGHAYEDMGQSLIQSYIPSYLGPDQAELYKMGLKDKAYVQFERAVNAYGHALSESSKHQLYNADAATAIARLEALRPKDFAPMVEPLALLTDPALAPTVEALQYRDYKNATSLLAAARSADPVQAKVAEAIIARGNKDFSAADRIYAAQLRKHPEDRALAGAAAAFYSAHLHDYKRAEKVLQSFVRANSGSIGPADPVFGWMEDIQRTKETEKQRRAEEAERAARESARAERAKQQLDTLRTATAKLSSFNTAHIDCEDYRLGIGDEVAMVIEQATMVIEAEEFDMAGDVLTFIEQIEPMAEEIVAMCR